MIAHADDAFLAEHGLVKGWMDLIDTERAVELYQALGSAVEMSGGSAANTMCGVASFGGRRRTSARCSDDDLGAVFGHDLLRGRRRSSGPGAPDRQMPTGRCIIVVTPDAERTMNTYLGASQPAGRRATSTTATVADGAVLYMEGYLFDRPEAKQAFRHAAGVAHAAGRMVSLTLSDSFCVDRHRDDFRSLVADEVDLLFGNDERADGAVPDRHLRGSDARPCVITARWRRSRSGPRGSIVVTEHDLIAVPAVPVRRVIDTTGAGDLYASGFLFGLTRGESLASAGISARWRRPR